jgi:hypothetical protein
MSTCFLTVLLIAFSLLSSALADPKNVSTNRQKTNEQQEYEKKLKQFQQTDPTNYEKIKRAKTLEAQTVLGRYGYGVGPYSGMLDEKTQQALKLYQKNNNLPINGDPLDFLTSKKIEEDNSLKGVHDVILGQKAINFESWDLGYVMAEGTWTIINAEAGIPLQTSRIFCNQRNATCIEASASLGADMVLAADLDIYEIERWDKNEILTKPLQKLCVQYVRLFNRAQNSINGIRTTLSRDGLCKGIEQRSIYTELSDGVEISVNRQIEYIRKEEKKYQYTDEALKFFERNK